MEGIELKGFYGYQLFDENGKLKKEREFHNTLTGAALQMLLNKASGCVDIGGDLYGMQATSQYIDKLGRYSDSQYNIERYCDNNKVLHNVLLNLSDTVRSNLNDNTTFIDTFDNNFVADNSKVLAKTGNTLTSGGPTEGIMMDCKSNYVMNKFIKAVRYKYDAGVATGTINCFAMMPGLCASNANADGIATSKCVDRVNIMDANYVGMSTAYLPPNTGSWTGDGEILLNYSQGNFAKHKVYLNGVTEPLDYGTSDAWPANLLTGDVLDYYNDGTYLYTLGFSRLPGSSGTNIIMTIYLISTMEQVNHIYLSYKISEEYPILAKFLKIGDQLYVNAASYKPIASITGAGKLWQLSKGSKAYWSSASSPITDFSTILTLPTGIDLGQVCFGNYGSNYIMYISSTLNTGEESKEGFKCVGYVFSSLSNIGGTKINKICGLVPNQCLFYGTTYKGFIRIGNNLYGPNDSQIGNGYDNSQAKKDTFVGTKQYVMNAYSTGCWITLEDWSSSLFSFKNLATADIITKGASDVLYVSWGIQTAIVAS